MLTAADSRFNSTNRYTSGVLLRDLMHSALDFCYPGACANCEIGVEGAGILCANCDDKLKLLINAPACEVCAKPLASPGGACPWCRGLGLRPFDRVVCL